MSDEQRLEEHAISEVVKQALSTQLDDAENIEVQVKTDLLKTVQGKADSISIEGQGLILQEDIRIQELEVQADEVSINPLSALFGAVELNHPVNTTARVVLTEADLNHTINSKYLKHKLSPAQLTVGDRTISVELESPLKIRLPSQGKIRFSGSMKLYENNEMQRVSFATVLYPRTETRPILLESFCCTPGKGFTIDFMVAFLQKLQDLVSQPYVELGEISFRVASIVVEKGSMTLQTEVYARQIPAL